MKNSSGLVPALVSYSVSKSQYLIFSDQQQQPSIDIDVKEIGFDQIELLSKSYSSRCVNRGGVSDSLTRTKSLETKESRENSPKKRTDEGTKNQPLTRRRRGASRRRPFRRATGWTDWPAPYSSPVDPPSPIRRAAAR